ncbi:MAG: S8 family serine peptidase [Pyrinomonadaceae bacterium]
MKKSWILLTALAVGVAAAFLTPSTIQGHRSKLRKAERPIPNRYIVALNPVALRASLETSDKSAGRLVSRFGGSVDKVFSHALQGFSAEMTPKAAEAMSNDPSVLFIEEDSYISVNTTTQPDAPWGLDRVDQRNIPLNTSYNYDKTGNGVNVYVIDTGVRVSHSEFAGRATADYDSMYDGQNGNDCHGHGTHVAATIGGINYGIAKNVSIHGVRVLGCNGIGTVSTAVEGIDWVTANHVSPAVANMSMGSNASPLLDFAVQGSIDSGVTYVAAAGNSSADACNTSPARLPAAITVGASDQTDQRASFSNYGSCVDLFAPGVSILSAWAWNDYASFSASGTSMAAPHVTGTVALYLEDHPNASPGEAASALVDDATGGAMSTTSDGSPNLMLFTAPTAPTAADAIVSGSVTDADGRGLRNVRVTLRRASDGQTRLAITNAFGYFRFDEVEVGDFYTASIQNKRYVFENSPFAFSLNDNLTSVAFVGIPR